MLACTLCSQHYNSLIQMSKRWKRQPTFYVSLPMLKPSIQNFKTYKEQCRNLWHHRYSLTNVLVHGTKKEIQKTFYVRFLPVCNIASADCCSPINDKYPTLYVRPSCLLTTVHFTDKNDQEVEEIANNIYYIFNVT